MGLQDRITECGLATTDRLSLIKLLSSYKLGARMLVLETQNCNVPAIHFYLKHGFQLIGFDLAHYTNDDIHRQEFRLEFGYYLN